MDYIEKIYKDLAYWTPLVENDLIGQAGSSLAICTKQLSPKFFASFTFTTE